MVTESQDGFRVPWLCQAQGCDVKRGSADSTTGMISPRAPGKLSELRRRSIMLRYRDDDKPKKPQSVAGMMAMAKVHGRAISEGCPFHGLRYLYTHVYCMVNMAARPSRCPRIYSH